MNGMYFQSLARQERTILLSTWQLLACYCHAKAVLGLAGEVETPRSYVAEHTSAYGACCVHAEQVL